MAASRSSAHGDPNIIQVGTDRMTIEGTLGAPNMMTSLDNGKSKAIYKIDPNAHSSGAKGAAVAGHLIMDVLTWGLWEVVGTPLEIAASDKLTTYLVYYGADNKVTQVETVK
jgi:hypothetical protein